MEVLKNIKEILADILDVEENEINEETYLIRELDAESIDLLEIAVALNNSFKKEIIDDQIFLKKLREFILEAKEKNLNVEEYLKDKYKFLSQERIREINNDLNNGPVVKVKDLISYISG